MARHRNHSRTSGPRGARAAAVVLLAAAATAGGLTALRPWEVAPDGGAAAALATPTGSPAPSPTPTPTRQPDAVFTIVAGGDVLPHDTVIRNARLADGSYDFVPLMSEVQDWTSGGDLALCNLEVPLAPDGTRPSGYPLFGAPRELAGNLAALGFDGCSTGTNHTLDRGYAGVVTTLDGLDSAGLGHAGSARSAAEADAPQFYELDRSGQTVKIAQIGGTYGTNGLPIPADAPWAVNVLDAERIVAQATAAREAGADLVVATLHWGVEYRVEPTEDQAAVATALAESGLVDLVIGTHAHIPQPMDRLPGGPGGAGMWVAYGLGNFISNQDTHCCIAQTNTGAFLTATVVKPWDGPARVTGLEWSAFPVDRLGGQRLHSANEILAGVRPDGLTLSDAEIEARRQRVAAVMGPVATERTQPPTPTGEPPRVLPRTS